MLMALSNHVTVPTISLSLILLLATFIPTDSKLQLGEPLETSMTLYIQDYSYGPNATLIPITGVSSDGDWAFHKFGTIFCTDDPITEALDASSTPVGRAQGIYVTSALDGSNTHVLISLVFTNEQYKGSTLEIQGASPQFERVREVSVVSGTGKFRFARGYATFETVHLDMAAAYSVIECNITMLHYLNLN